MMSFGQQLALALRDRKIKRAEFAKALGVGRSLVSHWCAGIHHPHPDRLAAINKLLGTKLSTGPRPVTADDVAKALGVSPDQLRQDMQNGHFAKLGEALPPRDGRTRWRYRFYPAKVAELLGI